MVQNFSRTAVVFMFSALAGLAIGQPAATTPASGPGAPSGTQPGERSVPDKGDGAMIVDPVVQEAPLLAGQTQLTFRKDFVKAGEAYFSPDMRWIIFQAVPVPRPASPDEVNPAAGKTDAASSLYSMYVAKLVWDEGRRSIRGIDEPILVSPPGSANTCGWFHPTEPGRIIFGSTLVAPSNQQKPGFQVGTNRYIWAFPSEMEIVTTQVGPVFLDYFANKGREEEARTGRRLTDPGTFPDQELRVVFAREGYDAECSYSPDGRFILYAHVDEKKNPAKPDADIWVYDTQTGEQHALVSAAGYDGGPFWSPDGRRICYRSDRKGDDLLQVFVADVVYKDGVPAGVENEIPITANEHVNWCPYWHPSGEFLIYATSEIGHRNYEVFAAAAPKGAAAGSDKPAVKRRVTFAEGADVLPAFSPDGQWMMWTSQRGPRAEGEERPSSQLWIARWKGASAAAIFGH